MSYGYEVFLFFFLPILLTIIFIFIMMEKYLWYSRPIKIDYFFKSKRFKTKNILTGRYEHGFDEKYKRSTRIYLVLTNDRVIIAPFYLRKTYILYNKIIKFDIVLKVPKKDYVVELDENSFPRNIRDLEYIEITYITDNGIEDIVVIELKYFLFWYGTYDRNYKFNKYVYSKYKVFNIVKNQINDKFIQSYYTSGRTFKKNTY